MSARFESGFSVRQAMWHGEGNVLEEYPDSWDDARLAAGLMWEPASRPVFAEPVLLPMAELHTVPAGSQLVGDPIDGKQWVAPAIEGHQRIVRDDTAATLGVPRDSYQVITHGQMGELLEAVLDLGSTVKFETAGSSNGGRQVWALAYLDEPWHAPGDESPTYPYLAVLNAHDGSAACKVLPTSVRVVCWNTWNAASAEGDRTGNQVSIRHTGNMAEHIEEAKQVLANVREDHHAWQVLATDLAGINVSDGLVRTFFEEFIPTPENATERTRNMRAERRALAQAIYDESVTIDGVRGTAYGLVQAAGEYLDHVRPYRNQDTYLARTMLRPEPIKGNVVRRVLELTGNN